MFAGFGALIPYSPLYISEHVPLELVATGQGIFQGISISLSQVIAAASASPVAPGAAPEVLP